jgi:hypothetical protein
MRIVNVLFVIALSFICGLFVTPAIGLETLVADGTWWQRLTADQKTASVEGMVSAYNFGYVDGRTDQASMDRPFVEFKLKSQKLSSLNYMAEESSWVDSSIGSQWDQNYSKTYKTYTDSIDNFYDNYPDLVKLEVGALIGCNNDHAKYTCDEVAKGMRHPPSTKPSSGWSLLH